MLPPLQIEQTIVSTIKEEWGRILASLVKSIGDLQLAEDVLQDAVEAALINWKKNGLPDSPAAWLIQTARRKAIDRFRRDSTFNKLQPQLSYWADINNEPDEAGIDEVIPDKRLELIFTCCHPSLEHKTKVALTLRTLGGLTTEEIARTFLDKPQAMAQRLVRAKKKITLAGIPYQVPEAEVLQERLSAVLAVIYFIFNEGYSASSGERVTRGDLCDEAIRLARITTNLLPDHAEVAGLLSLMLLHDSRRFARQDKAGDIVPLEKQNRSIWDKSKITEGTQLLKETLRRQQVGPYQLQAAISAIHAEAPDWQGTDWTQITALYELLHTMHPSPVVRINQAVSLSYTGDTTAALQMLDDIYSCSDIQQYQPYYAARADILLRTNKVPEAQPLLRKAIELSVNDAEKRFLKSRLTP